MRLSIRQQIVGPFVVLVIFVGIVGTAVVMSHEAASTAEQFDGSLLRASMLANDHLALLEADRLQLIRSAADTQGVPDMVKAGNRAGLRQLLVPVLANAASPDLTLRVLDQDGRLVLALRGADAATASEGAGSGSSYTSITEVRAVLAGRVDQQGDKYAFLALDGQLPVVDWIGPIRADDQSVRGAILLSQPLQSIAAGIRGVSNASDLVFFDAAGGPLFTSLPSQPPLSKSARTAVSADHPARVIETIDNHTYGLLVSDWRLRDRPVGYLGAALSADGWQSGVEALRVFLVLLFAAASLLALLIGVALARYITRPIDRLIEAIRRVGAGDLRHRAPVGAANEVGYLATAFNQMAAGLETKTDQLEHAYLATLEALARAIDARDPFTFEGSARIAAICNEVALAMDLPPADRQALHRGALLHDIGEIGVDDRILQSTRPLTDSEFAVIRRHPVIGYEMLKDLPFLVNSVTAIRHHHERWDGTGYPDGLRGTAIPLLARILSVADAFEAMTSDRAHRKSFSFEFAARALRAGAGSQFDPTVVEAFASRADAIIARMQAMGKQPTPHAADIHAVEEAV